MDTSMDLYPIQLIFSMEASDGTSIEKFPSRSVITAVVVPETMTAAPMTGLSSVSMTVPVTVLSWAERTPAKNRKVTADNINE